MRGLLLLLLPAACGGQPIWRGSPPPEDLEGLSSPELVAFSPDDDLAASLSPDGRFLVYASEQNGNLDVWVRDFGTNSNYPLSIDSPTDDWDPEVAPDGEAIAFVSRRADAKGDIFLVEGFGSEADPIRLTDERTADRQPRFSPAGDKLYFTSASGVGFERITELDLKTRARRPVSPTPGFDPAISPDGRYLVYTAPSGEANRRSPHLVAMRFSDSATRAVTAAVAPEGFARFVPGERYRLVYVRFADDDDGDGAIDANDRASLWRLDVDLDALFDGGRAVRARPFPLTDGSDDELFPVVASGALYFTQGTVQQDILRLPAGGMFPRYEDPARYFDLAKTFDEPRKRWFAYRCALARLPPEEELYAQSLLRIGNLHLERGRPDLGREAYRELSQVTEGAPPGSARAELRGLAEAELISIDREEALDQAVTPAGRKAVLDGILDRLEALAAEYESEKRVVARVELEMAEVTLDRGDRTRAIRAFERVTEEHADQSFSAARAMLRRIELLGVAHDPGAIGEAYARVLSRYPDQREVVREASRRIVEVHVTALRRGRSFRELVDELRRLVARYGSSPVRLEGRRRLTEILRENGALADAVLELEQLAAEAKGQGDRLAAARAQQELAEVEELLGRFDDAGVDWRELRTAYGDLPGVASTAREAITRVSLARAAIEERRGNAEAAREAYRDVVDNDLSQVEAHRRYLALSARVGKIDEALEQARARAEASPGTPIARYAYGLALTWLEPPKLDEAKEEVERAIELNPQFVHAYITRGWIAEMQHVAGKSTWDDFVEGVADVINFVIGEILDIEIDTEGLLEEAIENYKTALRLNQESLFPETEAEILINLGNAHYRLGDVTRDASNFRIAFERYLDALRLGYRFKNPLTKMAYFERFGRAAAWTEEWALSAMATRRAIRVAEEIGDERRLTQLYGNLALAYHQAGEEAYAKDALAQYGSRLEEQKSLERLLIARRERARARIGTLQGRSAEQLDSVLNDLAAARDDLARLGEIDRELPSVWVPVTSNLSSAVYGFQTEAERDLNLALAEKAHLRLGERSRAEAIRRLRLQVTQEALDSVPGAFAGLGQKWPVTLLMVQERIGLRVSAANDAYEQGDSEAGNRILQEALEELDQFLEEDSLAEDRPRLVLDRGRLVALMVERAAAAGRDPPGAVEIDQALDRIDEAAGTATTSALQSRLPETLGSTAAVTLTASVARGHPTLAGLAHRARAVEARLHHARGLSLVAAARRAAGRAEGLKPLLASLDAACERLVEARAAFTKAAFTAAGAGYGLGRRILALSLMNLSEVERTLHGPPVLIRALEEAARAFAEENGDLGLAAAMAVESRMVRGDLSGAKDALMAVPPQLMQGHEPLVEALFSRTASVALAGGRVEEALVALDRSLVYRRAIGPMIDYANIREPKERAVSERLALHLERLQAARRDLSWTDALAGESDVALAKRRVADEVAALRRMAKSAGDELSAEGAMRLFGRPSDATLIQYDLAPDEGVLLAAPVEGVVHLILIDGSTTTEQKYVHRATGTPIEQARRDLARLRRAVEAGTRDDRLIEPVRAALFAPLSAALAGKARLMLATSELGGPIPQVALPKGLDGPALAHLSAPSVLERVRAAQLVGVEGTLALSRAASKPLVEPGRRLVDEQVYGFRTGPREIALEPGEQRGLDQRSPVEELAGRASDTLVVEAEVRLEPAALERSAILLEERPVPESEDEIEDQREAAPDAFLTEVPLAALALPARVLVLARVSERSLGIPERAVPSSFGIRLDLTMALRGVGTTVLIPAAVPDEAVRRLLDRFMDLQDRYGAADALRRAQREVAEQWPSVISAAVVGAPGLDAEASRRFAAKRVKSAGRRAAGHFKARRYDAAVEAIKQWIRLQHASGKAGAVKFAYDALVGILAEHLSPPQPARAADHQKELVKHLEGQLEKKKGKARAKVEADLLDARLLLGRLYSRAQDFEKAERTFEAVVRDLKEKNDRIGLGSALHEYALHKKRMLDDEAAAALMEQAIVTYQRAGAYRMKKRPRDAEAAVLEVAAIYLNRLSDPERARRAFLRALSMARTDVGRINIEIGLARAARRSGDFDEASEHAARARDQAAAKKLEELGLSALIEAANVSWYRGDYRKGTELCHQSLSEVDQLLARLKQSLTSRPKKGRESLAQRRRELRRLQIYALSVCGLTAMSQRDFEAAKGHLERARRIAESIGNEREVSAQYNNLGRVYLEFGRLAEAIEAFRAAEKIDRRLDDRYALAYDLRNLGRALSLTGKREQARKALETALEYSAEVKDKNNELRARFGLGELFLEEGRLEEARRHYLDALPLAEELEVAELAWQIHRALGLMHERRGDTTAAETELRKAIDIVRSITGRAASSDFGPQRYAAFDDLITLLLDSDRVEEAFQVAEQARVLELSELVEDSRIDIGGPKIGALWRTAKATRTATAAAAALKELRKKRPRLARLLETGSLEELVPRVPEDAVVLVYRVTDGEVVTFAVEREGVTAGRAEIDRRAFAQLVEGYGRQMAARADVTVSSRRISELTLAPVLDRLGGKKRIALVPHGPLRYVAFAALPLADGDAVIDRLAVLTALGPKSAVSGLADPFSGLSKAPIVALGAGAPLPGRVDPPLPFAKKELEVIHEEYPRAALVSGRQLTKGAFLSSLERARGVFHFAGHSYLAGEGNGRFVDPLGGRLRTADGSVSMLDVLSSSTHAELVVLSACHTMLGPEGGPGASGDELRSLAQAFRFAGARWIVATSMHVHDLTASMVMKRFYRALRNEDVIFALRDAQRRVRALYPHPAWWATFSILI